MSRQQVRATGSVEKMDPVWAQIRREAEEIVRKERFIDDMLDLLATMGAFKEIMSINEILVTTGPTGRVGRVQLTVRFDKGIARSTISLHYDQGKWKEQLGCCREEVFRWPMQSAARRCWIPISP